MEGTLIIKKNPIFPIGIFIVLAIIMVLWISSYMGKNSNIEFGDCFSKNGVKSIFLMHNRRVLRTCEYAGGIIAQVLRNTGLRKNDWELERIIVADSEDDIIGKLIRLYPDPGVMEPYFKEVIQYLLKAVFP